MKIKSDENKQNKKRLFVDMDGTLAEWRNIRIEIEDSEDSLKDSIKEKLDRLDDILYTPGYFRTLKPYKNVVAAIRMMINEYGFNNSSKGEIYILSCYKKDVGDVSPLKEKNAWLDDNLPEIDSNHRIFVPDGENKTKYIPNGMQENDFLLDDYTKNLVDWEHASIKENRAIKLQNNVNGSKGKWSGNAISYEKSAFQIANSIDAIMDEMINISHETPQKDSESIKDEDFLSMYKTYSTANKVAVFCIEENIPKHILNKALTDNWNKFLFEVDNKKYELYYDSQDDLYSELNDMKHGRVQGIIPQKAVQMIKDTILKDLIEQKYTSEYMQIEDVEF